MAAEQKKMDLYQEINEIKKQQNETLDILRKLVAHQKKHGYEIDDTVPPKEAARLLHCSERKEQDLRSKGILKSTKIGRTVYIKISDIQELITNGH